MRTARGAIRDLPTHVLKDLADFGIEAIPQPPAEMHGLGSARTWWTETEAGGGWRSILGWAARLLRCLCGRNLEQQKTPAIQQQQVDVEKSNAGIGHRESCSSQANSRHKVRRRAPSKDQGQETPTDRISGRGPRAAEMSRLDFSNGDAKKKLRQRVSEVIGQVVFGRVTLKMITDELARRGVAYRHPIDRGTLVVRDCDLAEAEVDGHHRLLRTGVEGLLKTGEYREVIIETSKPVRISEPLRRDVELRSWAALSIPELQIRSASVPELSVDHRASVEQLEAGNVKCGILEATTVKVTDLIVKGDARATHVDVCHDMVIKGMLDNVSHIRVVGRAVIGSLGSNFSQNACVNGRALATEIAKKASLSVCRNGQTLTGLVARAKPIRRRATPESAIAQSADDFQVSVGQRNQEMDEDKQAKQSNKNKNRGLRI